MDKKKLMLIGVSSICILILGICSYIWFNKDDNKQVYENKKEEIKEHAAGSNWLSMMYETGPGTGEYSESKSSLWPESGYIFNDTLSGCENEGELSWNDETKAVILNSNSSDACYVYFDAYIIPVINSVTTSNITTDSITLTVNVTNGNNPVITYYYSKDNGSSYETSNSNTYTFSGLDMGTVYNFSVYVEDSAGYKSEVYNLSETTDDTPPTFADTCRETGSNTLACYIASQYTNDGENGLYYHDADLENGAEDNSYRYAGANPNNYVCFGSTASACPEDNLYRIIGVFGNEVKLIKSSSYGNYAWDSSDNTWSSSDIRSTLNNTFLNTFNSTWQNKIATHEFKVGGISSSAMGWSLKNVYDYEVGENSFNTTHSTKIGLMYVSDYVYTSYSNNWTTILYDYGFLTNPNDGWLYLGLNEWTISRTSDYLNNVYYIDEFGSINSYNNSLDSNVVYLYSIRPVFYLNSDVEYVSGTGTQSDPFRIA